MTKVHLQVGPAVGIVLLILHCGEVEVVQHCHFALVVDSFVEADG